MSFIFLLIPNSSRMPADNEHSDHLRININALYVYDVYTSVVCSVLLQSFRNIYFWFISFSQTENVIELCFKYQAFVAKCIFQFHPFAVIMLMNHFHSIHINTIKFKCTAHERMYCTQVNFPYVVSHIGVIYLIIFSSPLHRDVYTCSNMPTKKKRMKWK